jgi:signal transduction histidine kinase
MRDEPDAERLRRIVESTPDLILNLDREARIRFINRPLPRRTAEETLGTIAFDGLLGPDVQRFREAFRQVLETGAPRTLESRCFGAGWWLTRFIPMKRGEEVESVLVVATDVSEVRQTPVESLAMLAHDFNNLLTGILGSAGLASVKMPPGSAAREQIDRILAAAEEGAALTSRILASAELGQCPKAPIDLNVLVEEALSLARHSMVGNAVLKQALAPNLPAIEADRTQLQHALVSLLTSAADSLEGEDGEIGVRTGVMTSVDGPGVFLQVRGGVAGTDDVSRRLAAVQGIVRDHRGAIRLEGAPTQGTIVTVLFPALGPKSESDEHSPSERRAG